MRSVDWLPDGGRDVAAPVGVERRKSTPGFSLVCTMPNAVLSTCARRDGDRVMMAIGLWNQERGWRAAMRGCEGDRLTRREVEIQTGVEDESNNEPQPRTRS